MAPGHGQVNIRQDFSIQQCAVQVALRIIYIVAIAQCIQVIALSRVFRAGHHQGVHNATQVCHRALLLRQAFQLGVKKAQVKWRIVDYQLGTAHKFNEICSNPFKQRLVIEKLVGDAMDFYSALIYFPLGIDVLVVVVPGQAPVFKFYTPDFDDAMALRRLQASCFRV